MLFREYVLCFCCCYSVAKSCPAPCDPMDYSMPGSSVLHYLPEFVQIYVFWVGDISHLLPPATLFLFTSIFPSIRVFSNKSVLRIRWPKYWSFSISASNEYPGLIYFRIDLVWSPCSPRDTQESSLAPQFKSINSSALSLLYGPTLTSVHDCWKNHSFDYMDLC